MLNDNFNGTEFVDMSDPADYKRHFNHTFQSLTRTYPQLQNTSRGHWEYGPSAAEDQQQIFSNKYKDFNIVRGLEMRVLSDSRIVLKQDVDGAHCESDLRW